MRLLATESSHWLKKYNATRVKGIHANFTNEIWTQDNSIKINFVNEEVANPDEEVVHQTKNIPRVRVMPSVLEMVATGNIPSPSPATTVKFSGDIDADLRYPRRSGRVRNDPGKNQRKYRAKGVRKGSKRPVRRPKKHTEKISPLDYTVTELPPVWVAAKG